MLQLVIDIGNTSSKIGIYLDDTLIYHTQEIEISIYFIDQMIQKFSPASFILSHVNTQNQNLVEHLHQLLHGYIVTDSLPLPIINAYATPDTLGSDRLANAVGASSIHPNKNILIIDAGTCLKHDFISSDKKYLGGSISPGLKMRADALHNYTANLPLLNSFIQKDEQVELIGNSTLSAIQSGVEMGIIFESMGFFEAYAKKYDNLIVVLTGGDSAFFEKHLKTKIFALPNLTLFGLHKILEHQHKMN